jgi:hypothetical protein
VVSSTSWRSSSGTAGPESRSDELSAAALKLEAAEAEVLAPEARAFARALADPTAAARYQRLAEAAAGEAIPAELIGSLEVMLELLFEKGHPSNRAVLQAIYSRTARGRQLTLAAREVNKALEALRGQQLENVRIAAEPSRHTIVLETDRVRLTLELDSAGARVASLEAG